MTQPEYQPHATAANPPQTAPDIVASGAAPRPSGSPVQVSRGLLIAAWVVAASLAVLAVVAVVWTVELIRIQLELQEVVRSVRSYIAHIGGELGGGLGGGGASQCPDGQPVC